MIYNRRDNLAAWTTYQKVNPPQTRQTRQTRQTHQTKMAAAMLSNKSLNELKAEVTPFLLKSAAHTFELTLRTARALYEIRVRNLYKEFANSFEQFVEIEWKSKDHHVDVASASHLADAGEAWYLLEAAGVCQSDLPTSHTAARNLLVRAKQLDTSVPVVWTGLLQKYDNTGSVSVRKIREFGEYLKLMLEILMQYINIQI